MSQFAFAGSVLSGADTALAPRPSQADRWASLLVASGRGEEASFELLAQEVRDAMRFHAQRVLNDLEDVDEVVQESLLEAWCKAERFDPTRGGALTWLGAIVRHRAIDLVRQTTARRSREARDGHSSARVAGDDTVDSVLAIAEHDSVRTALSVLTDLQRQAVRLVYYEGLTSSQAAARLGVPVPTMKSRVHDGIGRLRGVVVTSSLESWDPQPDTAVPPMNVTSRRVSAVSSDLHRGEVGRQ